MPLDFSVLFDVFGGTPGDLKSRGHFGFGGRGGTQLIEYKNKALVYLYLDSLLPLRYGAFYMQPGGLVPRARGRIYVAFGEHPAAGGLYMSFWSLWHFAGPCGVSLALWVALGLHCGTLGFHFDTHGV